MKQPIILITTTLLVLFTSCKKEVEVETTTVNGLTFKCKVNGNPFIADYWDYGYNIPPIHIDFCWDPVNRKSYFKVLAEKKNESIRLYLNGTIGLGKKYLNTTTISWPCNVHPSDYGSYDIRYPAKEFLTNSISIGYVDVIYADTTRNKIEARFEFTAESATAEKIKVTDGYFKNF